MRSPPSPSPSVSRSRSPRWCRLTTASRNPARAQAARPKRIGRIAADRHQRLGQRQPERTEARAPPRGQQHHGGLDGRHRAVARRNDPNMLCERPMKICVIGTGYVGLVAGAGFSDMGNDVVCCDLDKAKIDGLKRGEIPIYEPGLDKLVAHNAAEGRLTFTTDVAKGVAGAEVILLAVGTPPGKDGSADLSFIFQAAESVASALTGWAVIVTKSTVPVGTGDKIEAIMRKKTTPRVRGGVEPRVPEGGRRGQRLHEAGSRDRRRRGQARDRRPARALRAVHAHERSHAGHGSPLGRADQVRRELDAGDAHLVHERPGQPVRAAGRRHRARAPRHGLRRAHRPQVPVRGPGLRRQLLSQGPARRDQHRAARSGTSWRSSTPSSPSTSGRSGAWARRSSPTSAAT